MTQITEHDGEEEGKSDDGKQGWKQQQQCEWHERSNK